MRWIENGISSKTGARPRYAGDKEPAAIIDGGELV
jgi:hypothetical protein